MKILIASDFFEDYELIECETLQQAIEYIKSNGETTTGIESLSSSNDFFIDDAKAQADKVIFMTDYIESEE